MAPCYSLSLVLPKFDSKLLVPMAALVLGLGLTVVSTPAAARTWLVRLDGSGDFTRIQEAVDAAEYGDTVRVGPGEYTWANQGPGNDTNHGMVVLWVDQPRGVTFESEMGSAETILDAQFQGRVMFANGNNVPDEPVEFTLRGFTLRNGVAPVVPQRPFPTEGGGLAMHLVYPLLEDVVFENNYAETGGGVWAGGVSSITFRNCRFVDNRALAGAGMLLAGSYAQSIVEDSVFSGNEAVEQLQTGAYGLGGGLYCYNNNFILRRSLFYDNSAETAGSAFITVNAKPGDVHNNVFRANECSGAAVYMAVNPAFGDGTADLDFHHNLVVSNGNGPAFFLEKDVQRDIRCNISYANLGGNWTASMAEYLGEDGNVSTDPKFCSSEPGVVEVSNDSPLLPINSACGERVGHAINAGPDCAGLAVTNPEPPIPAAGSNVSLRVFPSAPNPLRARAGNASVAFELPFSSHVDVRVHDVSGRLVRGLSHGFRQAGRHTVSWAARDDQGSRVAAGVYFVRIEAAGRRGASRVVVLP